MVPVFLSEQELQYKPFSGRIQIYMPGYFDIDDHMWSIARPLPHEIHMVMHSAYKPQRVWTVESAISFLLQDNLVFYKRGMVMIALMHDPENLGDGFTVFQAVAKGILTMDCPVHGVETYELDEKTGVFAEYDSAAALTDLPYNWEDFRTVPYVDLINYANTVR